MKVILAVLAAVVVYAVVATTVIVTRKVDTASELSLALATELVIARSDLRAVTVRANEQIDKGNAEIEKANAEIARLARDLEVCAANK